MTEATQPLAIKWAYRNGGLEPDLYDSVDEALSAGRWAWNAGDESIDCIEVWDNKGHRVFDRATVLLHYSEIDDAERAAQPPEPPIVARVELRSPAGKWATYSGYRSQDDAEAEAERLRPRMGDRVKVAPVKHRSRRAS